MQSYFMSVSREVTRGRPKRKRRPGAGSAVKVGGHTRTPRGPNRGKPAVRVDGYRRGAGKRKRRRKRS
jgi:hypothetical protein